jgi:hypothetical protein
MTTEKYKTIMQVKSFVKLEYAKNDFLIKTLLGEK